MKRLVWTAITIFGAGCGGDVGSIRAAFNLSAEPCTRDTRCGPRLETPALVMESDAENAPAGELLLFADVTTSSGALAVLELFHRGTDEVELRYREHHQERVTFDGVILSQQTQITRGIDGLVLSGRFAFHAEDSQGRGERWITAGELVPPEQPVQAAPGGGGGGGTVVVIDPSTPPRPRRPAPEPDEVEEDYGDGGGCEDSGGGGCESSDSGGGCEAGDSGGGSGGGCEESGSGCEGDTVDAGGCDCEGDTLASAQQQRRAASGAWRLAWPIVLAGFFNRRFKRVAEARSRASAAHDGGAGEDVVQRAPIAIDDAPQVASAGQSEPQHREDRP